MLLVAAGTVLVTSLAVMPVPGVLEFRTPDGEPRAHRGFLRAEVARPRP